MDMRLVLNNSVHFINTQYILYVYFDSFFHATVKIWWAYGSKYKESYYLLESVAALMTSLLFSSLSSHLPTHRITVYPMVTIRISDRHRLIQPYIHNYSWLLFAALSLFTSELVSEREQEGEPLDDVTLGYARALQTRCSDLINECLLKGQTGKGGRHIVFTLSVHLLWACNKSNIPMGFAHLSNQCLCVVL